LFEQFNRARNKKKCDNRKARKTVTNCVSVGAVGQWVCVKDVLLQDVRKTAEDEKKCHKFVMAGIFLLWSVFLSANHSGASLIVHTYGTHVQKRAACMFGHWSVPQRLLAAGLVCSPRWKAPS
jgi:hypothetical protein